VGIALNFEGCTTQNSSSFILARAIWDGGLDVHLVDLWFTGWLGTHGHSLGLGCVGMGWDAWRLVIVSSEMVSHSLISGLFLSEGMSLRGHGVFKLLGLLNWIGSSKERLMRREWLVVLENMEKMRYQEIGLHERRFCHIREFSNFLGPKIVLLEDSNERSDINHSSR
jgi:hypothetical protein